MMKSASALNPALVQVPSAPAQHVHGAPSLTEALVNAYYQRDIEAIRRIGHQVEERLAALSQPRRAA